MSDWIPMQDNPGGGLNNKQFAEWLARRRVLAQKAQKPVQDNSVSRLAANKAEALAYKARKANVIRALPGINLLSLILGYANDPEQAWASQMGLNLAPQGSLSRDYQLGRVA